MGLNQSRQLAPAIVFFLPLIEFRVSFCKPKLITKLLRRSASSFTNTTLQTLIHHARTTAMEISASTGVITAPSDPENLSVSESDGCIEHSSVDTDPESGLEIACDIIDSFNQRSGPWLFEVCTCAFNDRQEEVASVHAYLIKKENIQAHENKKKSLRKALRDEDPMLNVMFELPKIFHPHGHVNPKFLTALGHCIGVDDNQVLGTSSSTTEKPQERAWILLIRDVMVDVKYRRLGIGGNMIRRTLQRVMAESSAADRPLIVMVQPKRTDEFSDEQWSEIYDMIYNCRVNEIFWESLEFMRLHSRFSGFTSPWFIWGSALRLPPKKKITIPDDLETRNTRTATPPPRPHSPRQSNQPTPYDWFPVVEGGEVRSFIDPLTKLPALRPAPPRNEAAYDDYNDDNAPWIDNPDDPSITQEYSRCIKGLMHRMDATGERYRVRPLKEPVQAPVAQNMSGQTNCPFKAPPRVEALRSHDPIHAQQPDPICSASFQRSGAPEPTPLPGPRRSFRNQACSAVPGSRFLVTYVFLADLRELIGLADMK